MLKTNQNYKLLNTSYLFPEIKRKVALFSSEFPNITLFNLGEGDTTQPLASSVSKSMIKKIEDLGLATLKSQIASNYNNSYAKNFDLSEIFISDGAKTDLFNIQAIFQSGMKVALQNPSYPAYIDSFVINGNANDLVYLVGNAENKFVPSLPTQRVDLMYLCFPNNPTGASASYVQLKQFVDYALKKRTLIIYDSVYSWFIEDPRYPRSIYEIPGADECAIEIQSLSKIASFPSLRLGWTIIPQKLLAGSFKRREINNIWKRRQQTAFNGASIVSQAGAISALSDKGLKECDKNIKYYLKNTKLIKNCCEKIGLECFGGTNSPYVWCKTPNKMTSWEFFDFLLKEANTICAPGVGFGSLGEGFFRLSGFAKNKEVLNATQHITKAFLLLK